MMSIFMICVIYIIRSNNHDLFRISLPWVAIALFAIFSGLMIVIGRLVLILKSPILTDIIFILRASRYPPSI